MSDTAGARTCGCSSICCGGAGAAAAELAGATNAPAIVSTRKFDRYGDWHYFTMPFRIVWDAIRRRDTTARRYWYGER